MNTEKTEESFQKEQNENSINIQKKQMRNIDMLRYLEDKLAELDTPPTTPPITAPKAPLPPLPILFPKTPPITAPETAPIAAPLCVLFVFLTASQLEIKIVEAKITVPNVPLFTFISALFTFVKIDTLLRLVYYLHLFYQ